MKQNRARLLLLGLAGAILLLVPVPAAFAQAGYPPGPASPAAGAGVGAAGVGAADVVVFTEVSPTAVAVKPTPVTQSRPLARTGADLFRPIALAVAFVGTGALLVVVVGRRRPQPRT